MTINYFDDTRNVIDAYKGLSNEEIKANNLAKSFPYAVMMQHITMDFNLGSVIRSSNSLGAREVFYYAGKRHIDKRSTVGTHHYMNITHIKTIEDLLPLKDKYTFIGVDNIPGSVPMNDFVWPKNTLMIFGEESCGLVPEIIELCDSIVHIEQFGSVRSMNVGTAAGITMYDYTVKYKKYHANS